MKSKEGKKNIHYFYFSSRAASAATTGKWSQFASAYFKNTKKLINSLAGGNGFDGEGEATQADLYLLGFIILESRHGQLESRALNLLLRANEICAGLLDPTKTR